MLRGIISQIRGVMIKILRIEDVQRSLGTEIAISDLMRHHIELWSQMFMDTPPWLEEKDKSLSLPASIANEIARLVTVETKVQLSDGARATYLAEQLQPVLDGLQKYTEYAVAGGGAAFKPYLDDGRLCVDCVPAWRFFPTAFNGRGEVTGAVFLEQVRHGALFYTRMEYHELTDAAYRIQNLAFRSRNEGDLGTPCELGAVDEWKDLEPEITLRYKDGTAPAGVLFAYFKIPWANNIDPASPLGVSVFSRAESLIQQADLQYGRVLWEYEGGELAVDASEDALHRDKDGRINMPKRDHRLFRGLNFDGGEKSGDLYKVFSPALRDDSLFNGLNQLLRRIEFNCGLSYGTLSDPQNVDKTAEEIKSSKQRSYSSICSIQKALQTALEQLLFAMDFYTSLYQLAPDGEYQAVFTWGDGVLEDTDTEFVRRKLLVDGGYLKPEVLLAWYFGTSEDEARKMLPDNSDLSLE